MGKSKDQGETKTAGKPDKKRFRETTKRLRDGRKNNLKHRPSIEWRLDRTRVCDAAAPLDIIPISELTAIIMQSRTGVSLMQEAVLPVDIVYDRQTAVSQYYPRADKHIIALNPNRPKGDLVNLLVRELRRAWQQQQGALVNPLSYEPDDAILVNRAQQADVFMISVKVAWELKLAGLTEAWDFLTGSPMADIGRTFEIKAQTDFRTLNNGEAARAAYDKFFEDSRTRAHDKRIIHQMLLDDSGYIKSRQKRPRISMDLFKRLGELPHGRNYLAMKARRTPMDQAYATIEDRSNANFLWFIKFERSFQEKELQMIEESVKLSAEIVDFAKWSLRRNGEQSA
jgi:hypothetical protein